MKFPGERKGLGVGHSVVDQLPLEQWLALWATLTPKAAASMTYIVRMVQIDSGKPMPDAERVRQRTFEIVKGVDS